MNIRGNKVVIVGAGIVGSAVGYSLAVQEVCSQIVFVDVNKEKAYAEALDISHGTQYLNRNVRVRSGNYDECCDSDIVVITAALPTTGADRLKMLAKNIDITREIVKNVMASGFDGMFVVVSNPVDILSYVVYEESKLPKAQVIGSGTALETARLHMILGSAIKVDPRSVEAYAIGEHGNSMLIPWNSVRIGGKDIQDIMADNAELFSGLDKEKLQSMTIQAGYEVFNRKGSTQYGIASTTAAIIKAILRDENCIITVSTLLDGEYSNSGMFAGVPTVLGKEGVVDLVNLKLTADEQKDFDRSIALLKETYAKFI